MTKNVIQDKKDFGHMPFETFVVVTRLLPRNGGMAEDHGVPEAGKRPTAWTGGRMETESR